MGVTQIVENRSAAQAFQRFAFQLPWEERLKTFQTSCTRLILWWPIWLLPQVLRFRWQDLWGKKLTNSPVSLPKRTSTRIFPAVRLWIRTVKRKTSYRNTKGFRWGPQSFNGHMQRQYNRPRRVQYLYILTWVGYLPSRPQWLQDIKQVPPEAPSSSLFNTSGAQTGSFRVWRKRSVTVHTRYGTVVYY